MRAAESKPISMKNKILYLILYIFVICSCQKEQLENNISSHPFLENVTIKNGRLHFPSKRQLYNAEEALNQEERIDLTSWHNQIGFQRRDRLRFSQSTLGKGPHE